LLGGRKQEPLTDTSDGSLVDCYPTNVQASQEWRRQWIDWIPAATGNRDVCMKFLRALYVSCLPWSNAGLP